MSGCVWSIQVPNRCGWIMSFFFNTVLTFYKTTRCQQVSGGPELKHLETTFRSDRCPSGPSWLLGNFLSRGGFQLEVMLVWNFGSQQNPVEMRPGGEMSSSRSSEEELRSGMRKGSSVTEQVILRSRTFQNKMFMKYPNGWLVRLGCRPAGAHLDNYAIVKHVQPETPEVSSFIPFWPFCPPSGEWRVQFPLNASCCVWLLTACDILRTDEVLLRVKMSVQMWENILPVV